MDQFRAISNVNIPNYLTKGKIYEFTKSEIDYICAYNSINDYNTSNLLRLVFIKKYFTIITKYYPNTSFFKKLYPNGQIWGNFWRVD